MAAALAQPRSATEEASELSTAHDPARVAQAIHDVTCPEGPDCRDRLLHSTEQPLAYNGVLAAFVDRLAELEARDVEIRKLRAEVADAQAHPQPASLSESLGPDSAAASVSPEQPYLPAALVTRLPDGSLIVLHGQAEQIETSAEPLPVGLAEPWEAVAVGPGDFTTSARWRPGSFTWQRLPDGTTDVQVFEDPGPDGPSFRLTPTDNDLRARVAEIEAAGRALLTELDDYGDGETNAVRQFRVVLDGGSSLAGEHPAEGYADAHGQPVDGIVTVTPIGPALPPLGRR